VDDAEARIAVGDALGDHPKRDEVVHLLETDPARLHLSMQRVEVFTPSTCLYRESTGDQHLLELRGDIRHVAVGAFRHRFHLCLEGVVGFGLEVLEAQIF
jgi:hypothetical protein